MFRANLSGLCGAILVATPLFADVDPNLLATIATAKSSSDNNQSKAAEAWRNVADQPLSQLPAVLAAFDEANPIGVNWLSSAIDGMLQKAKAAGQTLPHEILQAYALDSDRGWRGRQMALELLREEDSDLAETVISKLQEDASAELRYPAIERLIKLAEQEEDDAKKVERYQEVFRLALSERHVVQSVVALRNLGHPVDHIRKFGLLMHWHVIGPFDYEDGKGFESEFPPESLRLDNYQGPQGIISEAKFDGKGDDQIGWKEYVCTARNGSVNLNKAVGELRDSVAYGATIFESEREQSVQLRLRQQNSAKVWLNGELVFSQPGGHTGNFFDQYIVPVTMKKGPNLILVKSCQIAGPVYHPFVNTWQLSVRVTDETGNAILAANRPPTPELDPLPKPPGSSSKPDKASDDEPSGDEAPTKDEGESDEN